jgi:hypothetical protein
LRSVGRVALFHVVVQREPADVVDDLGLVAELDRTVDTALADRPCLGVVQADQAGGRVGLAAIEAETGVMQNAEPVRDVRRDGGCPPVESLT